jgi:CRISPR-associated protein Cas6
MSTKTQDNLAPAPAIIADLSTYVTVNFPVQGRQLPADHGYALYAAITRQLPALQGATWLGIELLNGVPWREDLIVIPTRGAVLRLRIPVDRCGHVLPLTGHCFDIAGHSIRLGSPTVSPIQPARSLYARCVTIKEFIEPESLLDAAYRELHALSLTADLELPTDEQGRLCRYITKIRGRVIVGFSLAAHNLSDEDSLHLQSVGIGGHHAMGCGLFNPIVNLYGRKERV